MLPGDEQDVKEEGRKCYHNAGYRLDEMPRATHRFGPRMATKMDDKKESLAHQIEPASA